MRWVKFGLLLFILSSVIFLVSCKKCCDRCAILPPEVASSVDFSRYAGVWNEIAAFPNRFEVGCHCSKADYSTLTYGKGSVTMSCEREGKLESMKATFWVVDESHARLRLRFHWPFYSNSWILYVSPDYRDALVGTPDRDRLWVMSRSPKLNQKMLDKLTDIAKQQGYPVENLKVTTESSCTN